MNREKGMSYHEKRQRYYSKVTKLYFKEGLGYLRICLSIKLAVHFSIKLAVHFSIKFYT